MKYGDVVHYRWEDVDAPHAGDIHSAAFVVGRSLRDAGSFALLLPIADSHVRHDLNAPIVAKVAANWQPCTAACPFNPDHVGEQP